MELIKNRGGDLMIYDAEKGLKEIAVSEAAEKHWRRAKDSEKLFEAVKAKLTAQAQYVVWRDRVVDNPQGGRPRKNGPRTATVLPEADPGKRTIHRWRKRLCTDGRADGAKIEVHAKKLIDAIEEVSGICCRVAEFENITTVRGTEGTGEFERYTPGLYIDAARRVLGEIDLDPATSKQAQKTVRAKQYYTEKDDGLAQDWNGRVWLNPPYHRELGPKFIDKLIAEYVAGRITQAVVLVNNCADTDWFNVAIAQCASICFVHGRIRFTQPNGKEVLPTQGQTFFYFGPDPQRFEDVFCVIGNCLRVSRSYVASASDAVEWPSMGLGNEGGAIAP